MTTRLGDQNGSESSSVLALDVKISLGNESDDSEDEEVAMNCLGGLRADSDMDTTDASSDEEDYDLYDEYVVSCYVVCMLREQNAHCTESHASCDSHLACFL